MRARQFAVVLGSVLALLLALTGPARAQEPDYEAARAAYKKAEDALAKGEYGIAAREFGTAYEITKDPVLFYRIALAWEQSGDCDTAVVYYERYLKEGNPEAEDRRTAEAAVTRCRGGGGAGAGETTAAGAGATTGPGGTTGTGGTTGADTGGTTGAGETTSESAGAGGSAGAGATSPFVVDEEQRTWKHTAAWVSVGAAVAFLTTGAVLGLSASSRQEDIEQLLNFRDANGDPANFDDIRADYEDLIDEGERLDTMSKVAFGVAGAAAISATIFFILDAQAAKPGEQAVSQGRQLRPVVGDGQVGVSLGWSF